MDDCATQETMRFQTRSALALEAAFDGGRLTSDGGLLWLAEMDSDLGFPDTIGDGLWSVEDKEARSCELSR